MKHKRKQKWNFVFVVGEGSTEITIFVIELNLKGQIYFPSRATSFHYWKLTGKYQWRGPFFFSSISEGQNSLSIEKKNWLKTWKSFFAFPAFNHSMRKCFIFRCELFYFISFLGKMAKETKLMWQNKNERRKNFFISASRNHINLFSSFYPFPFQLLASSFVDLNDDKMKSFGCHLSFSNVDEQLLTATTVTTTKPYKCDAIVAPLRTLWQFPFCSVFFVVRLKLFAWVKIRNMLENKFLFLFSHFFSQFCLIFIAYAHSYNCHIQCLFIHLQVHSITMNTWHSSKNSRTAVTLTQIE